MEKIRIKNSELDVSRLCFGGCPMGRHGWGLDVFKDNFIYAIDAAMDRGVNFFDTADIYGLGKGEETLGEALGGKREDAIIATKFGVRIIDDKTIYDNSNDWIQTAVRKSLKRLGTDYIDIYQVHYRDGVTSLSEVIKSLELLKKDGLIRYYGFSNIYEKDIEELKEHKGQFVSFQNEYSLACRQYEKDIISLSTELDTSPLTWGSLGEGILTGKYDINSKFGENDRRSRLNYVNFHGDKLRHNLEIVDKMKEISEHIGKPIPAVAIRWILDYIPGSVVLTGIKNVGQLESNVSALGWNLSDEHIKMLDEISS